MNFSSTNSTIMYPGSQGSDLAFDFLGFKFLRIVVFIWTTLQDDSANIRMSPRVGACARDTALSRLPFQLMEHMTALRPVKKCQ